MKDKIVKVKKHFQRIKYIDMDDAWHPKLVKCHLRDKVPIGHMVYIEKDKKRIVQTLIDLTMIFGDSPMSEIKRNFKPYKPYQNYDEGEPL